VLEQMRDEPAQVVGGRVERVRTVEEVDRHPGGLGVGADGGVAAVLGARGAWVHSEALAGWRPPVDERCASGCATCDSLV
jgi:hypothetical protein